MSYVLDTNALAALMRAEPGALARLRSVARDQIGVPQPVVAAIQYGLARLPASRRKHALESRWQLFAAELPRIHWTEDVSREFGLLKASLEKRGQRLDDFDVAIAAHALALDAVLVTANRRQMARVPGLRIDDWG